MAIKSHLTNISWTFSSSEKPKVCRLRFSHSGFSTSLNLNVSLVAMTQRRPILLLVTRTICYEALHQPSLRQCKDYPFPILSPLSFSVVSSALGLIKLAHKHTSSPPSSIVYPRYGLHCPGTGGYDIIYRDDSLQTAFPRKQATPMAS